MVETFIAVLISLLLSTFFDTPMLPFLVNGVMLGISIAVLATFLQYWFYERLSAELHVAISLISGVLSGLIAGLVTGLSKGEVFWNWFS